MDIKNTLLVRELFVYHEQLLETKLNHISVIVVDHT